MTPNNLKDVDRNSFLHPFTALAAHAETGPRVISKGLGIRLTDSNGVSRIDGLAGLWCVNVGYGRREIADAIHRQSLQLSYYHSFASMGTEPSIVLADRIVRIAPRNLTKVLFGNSGSDANDTILKLVWLYNNFRNRPHKKKIIVRRRAYHGVTVALAAASGLPTVHRVFDMPIDRFRHVSPACYYWRADSAWSEAEYTRFLLTELEQTIINEDPQTIAAFLAEPIAGAGGVFVPPTGYWSGVQAILKKYDVLLIADEVITGFGRTGHMFASETFGIQPDLMSIAKGLTSGYVPMSASLVSDEIWDTLLSGYRNLGTFGHGYTYSAHPLAAAAGIASLDIIEREGLVERSREMGAYLQKSLRQALGGHHWVGDVRGAGLIAGVEINREIAISLRASKPSASPARAVTERCYEKGLIVRPLMDCDVIAISPPLVIDRTEIDELVGVLSESIIAEARISA